MESVEAMFHSAGPTGTFYNYSDGGEHANLEGMTHWFSRQSNQLALAQLEDETLRKYRESAPKPDSQPERTLPLVALWCPEKAAQPLGLPLNWMGAGTLLSLASDNAPCVLANRPWRPRKSSW